MLVDVHAHMDFPQFRKDIDQVIKRSEEAGVSAIISNGVSHETNVRTLELAEKFPLIKPALGFYPTDALEVSEDEFEKELDFIRKNKSKIVAIGEIGIDFKYAKDKFEGQKKNFVKLLELSEELKLPAIVHSRQAEKEVVEILETTKLKKIVMHCFSPNMKLIKRSEDNGWMFSIPCNIVFSEHFQNVVQEVSISNILTETDAPFLSPIKGERNEPKNIAYTIDKISEIKNLEKEEVKKIIFMNYKKLF